MPVPDWSLKDDNFVIHFDGGTRGDDCSAAAWILEARLSREQQLIEFPVAYCGKFMCPAFSSFVAESIALESCTDFFSKLIMQLQSTTEPAHKRCRSV